MNAVKEMHSSGGQGSQGYQYDWQISEAHKNLLRTHTTAVSARMLYKLAQEVSNAFFIICYIFLNFVERIPSGEIFLN